MSNYKLVLHKKQLYTALLAIDPEFPYVRGWVSHLIKYKGIPGFVQLWKKLKAWALKLISGESQYREEWFSLDTYCGFRIPRKYKQIFHVLVGALIRWDTAPKRESIIITKVLSVLNLHHVITGPSDIDISNQVETALQNRVDCDCSQHHKFWLKSLKSSCMIFSRRLSSKLGRLGPTGQTMALSPGKNGVWADFVSQVLVEQYGGVDHCINESKLYRRADLTFMGNLTFIGDTGGKTRTILVANPFIQSFLVPLKRELLDLLKLVPTDCTHEQEKGPRFIKEMQSLRRKIYSVDLKDATWNFPSSLQKEVLMCLGCKKEVLDLMFNSRVHNPLSGEFHLIEKGQAMGLGPSFPLFSLTHNLILYSICKMVGEIPERTFRVLGDDVIISSETVYRIYRQFLNSYKVPISVAKTLSSLTTAEFAGKIVHKGLDITPIKWKILSWNSMSSLYWKYRKTFRSLTKVRNLVDSKARFALYVLGPIPKKLGGLGLRMEHLKNNPGIQSMRNGILEAMIERGNGGNSSGVVKISNRNLSAPLTPSHDHEQLRFLDGMLTTRAHLETEWGVLPSLCPNPFRFLNQVGLTVRGIPLRESFDPLGQYWLRFRSSKQKGLEYGRDLIYQLLESNKEATDEQESEKDLASVGSEEQETINHYYTN